MVGRGHLQSPPRLSVSTTSPLQPLRLPIRKDLSYTLCPATLRKQGGKNIKARLFCRPVFALRSFFLSTISNLHHQQSKTSLNIVTKRLTWSYEGHGPIYTNQRQSVTVLQCKNEWLLFYLLQEKHLGYFLWADSALPWHLFLPYALSLWGLARPLSKIFSNGGQAAKDGIHEEENTGLKDSERKGINSVSSTVLNVL